MFLKLRRIIALYIDYCLIFFTAYYFTKLLSFFDNKFYNNIIGIISIILLVYLFLKKDCLIGYESIGKKLMFLKIYQNGKPVKDKKILTQRIIKTFWTIPFYPFMIIKNNKSEGDIICNTEVKSSISKKLKF